MFRDRVIGLLLLGSILFSNSLMMYPYLQYNVSAEVIQNLDESEKTVMPSNLKVSEITEDTCRLSWTKAESEVLGYRVYVFNEEKHKYIKCGDCKGTSCRLKNLQSGIEYKFAVVSLIKANGVVFPNKHAIAIKVKTKVPAIIYNNGMEISSSSLIFGVKAGTTEEDLQEMLAKYDAYVMYNYGIINAFAIGFKNGKTAEELSQIKKELEENYDYIEYVEFDGIAHTNNMNSVF